MFEEQEVSEEWKEIDQQTPLSQVGERKFITGLSLKNCSSVGNL